MAQDKPTTSHLIDATNVALAKAQKLLNEGTSVDHFKTGFEGLRIATESVRFLIDKSSLLPPDELQRAVGIKPDR